MEFYGGGGGGGHGGVVRVEAERWLEIAGKLLVARDVMGSKRFAERALEADPLLDGVDQILAVADVLLASQRRVNNQLDWYAVLQIPHPTFSVDADADADNDGGGAGGGGVDPVTVKRHYRRLALLLHPERNRYPGADSAFRYVLDAFAVLSDPSKKALFDAELQLAAAPPPPKPSPPPPPPPPPPSSSKPPAAAAAAAAAAEAPPSDPNAFWTACPSCCNIHQYARAYLNRSLRCPTCRRPFQAAEVASPPPVVPGADMYYCSWGFFPLGFPKAPDVSSDWKPFHPIFPWRGADQPPHPPPPPPPPPGPTNQRSDPPNGHGHSHSQQSGSGGGGKNRKTMARKKVGGGLKKKSLGAESEPAAVLGSSNPNSNPGANPNMGVEEVRGIDINEEAKFPEGGVNMVGDEEMMNFHIDVDATAELLGNLQNLPFLSPVQMP